MGNILCGIHGRQRIVLASAYLVGRIDAGLPPERATCVLKLNLADLVKGPGWFLVDEDFVRAMGEAHPPGGQLDVDDEDRAYELLGQLAPVCARCFGDYLPRFGLASPGAPAQ